MYVPCMYKQMYIHTNIALIEVRPSLYRGLLRYFHVVRYERQGTPSSIYTHDGRYVCIA